MAGQPSVGQITESDFDDLLRALSGTVKGRLFLAEYRRRARPEETGSLMDAMRRIETNVGRVGDALKPERIADELRSIAMTLELAAEGANADADGDEIARRMALVGRARLELTMLAGSLAQEFAPPVESGGMRQAPAEAEPHDLYAPEAIEDDLVLMD